jgi:hypothetical protein
MLLKDLTVRDAKPRGKPYKLSDGGGLHALVQLTGSKLWRLAYHPLSAQIAPAPHPFECPTKWRNRSTSNVDNQS